MAIITLVGSGQMASSLTVPALDNGHTVRLVGSPLDTEIIERLRQDDYHINLKRTLPDGINYYTVEELDEALKDSDVVVAGVSSFGVDWFGEEVLPKIDKETPVLSVTKGMIGEEDGSMITYLDYWKEKSGEHNLNAIGGPCVSFELIDHDPTTVIFCGSDKETLHQLKDLFKTDSYLVSLSDDIVGVEFSVALKNAYASAVAMAIGLSEKKDPDKIHFNSQAALFGQAITEISRLLDLVGGRQENLTYGIGDLYVTVMNGRSRRIGILLGKGYPYEEAKEILKGETLESIVIATRTAEALRRLAEQGKADLKDFPLLMHFDEIIRGEKGVDIPWNDFELDLVQS